MEKGPQRQLRALLVVNAEAGARTRADNCVSPVIRGAPSLQFFKVGPRQLNEMHPEVFRPRPVVELLRIRSLAIDVHT